VSIYYQFGPNPLLNDYYGYAAHGLVDQAQSLPELAGLLLNYQKFKPLSHFQHAGYYNATIGTPHEGHSRDLAIAVLSDWLR